MTTGGWIFMLTSLSFVWGLVIWCLWRVLTTPKNNNTTHAPPRSGD